MRQYNIDGEGNPVSVPGPVDVHISVVVSDTDFAWLAENHRSWGWTGDQFTEYLDAESEAVANVQALGGRVFLTVFEVDDYIDYCEDRSLPADSSESRDQYAKWLTTEAGAEAWHYEFGEWVTQVLAYSDIDDELEARGLTTDDLDAGLAPLYESLTDTWNPLFGAGNHTVAVLRDDVDGTPTVVHIAHSFPGGGDVTVWEDSMDLIEPSIGEVWLYGGTVLASRYDDDGTVTRVAWTMTDDGFTQMTPEAVAERFGTRSEFDELIRKSPIESGYICISSDAGELDSEYVLADEPIYEKPDAIHVADTLRACHVPCLFTITELVDPLTRRKIVRAWDYTKGKNKPLSAREARLALSDGMADAGCIEFTDAWGV